MQLQRIRKESSNSDLRIASPKIPSTNTNVELLRGAFSIYIVYRNFKIQFLFLSKRQ